MNEYDKQYRLHVWRDHLNRPCSVCGSTTYRSLNTDRHGFRLCGQCAREKIGYCWSCHAPYKMATEPVYCQHCNTTLQAPF